MNYSRSSFLTNFKKLLPRGKVLLITLIVEGISSSITVFQLNNSKTLKKYQLRKSCNWQVNLLNQVIKVNSCTNLIAIQVQESQSSPFLKKHSKMLRIAWLTCVNKFRFQYVRPKTNQIKLKWAQELLQGCQLSLQHILLQKGINLNLFLSRRFWSITVRWIFQLCLEVCQLSKVVKVETIYLCIACLM